MRLIISVFTDTFDKLNICLVTKLINLKNIYLTGTYHLKCSVHDFKTSFKFCVLKKKKKKIEILMAELETKQAGLCAL